MIGNLALHLPSNNLIWQNPYGKTGMRGRGTLGRWGPNEAIDYIVSRFKRDENDVILYREGKPLLEFLCIKRPDGIWALPGNLL